MDRLFDRAFNKAHGTVHAVTGSALASAEQKEQQEKKSKADNLRCLTTPMTSEDVLQRIDLAFKDNDFFRLLQLPGPALNDLQKAEWPVTSSELSKAYRKLSILVHPDKDPRPEARQAFEQLKHAYNELRDPDKLAARLREAEPALIKAAERAAATASMSERVEMNAAAEERKAKLRQEEARSFQQEIQQQMKRRQEAAALKKQRAHASRHRQQQQSSDEELGKPGDSSDDDYTRRQVTKKRKKPSFM